MLGVTVAASRPTREGVTRHNPALAWAVYGDPGAAAEYGWTLVFHALTGSQRVHEWWGEQIAPAGPLGARGPVLAANLPGSCYGSAFPGRRVTPRCMAEAHLPLIEELGIERLSLVTGGSLGGMVALEWLRVSPVPIKRAVIFAAPARASAQVIAWNAAQRMALEAGGPAGLAAARAIAMITYRSPGEFEERFGRTKSRDPHVFDAETWLRNHGAKLARRFDTAAYGALTHAMDAHDVGPLAAAAAETGARCGEVIGAGIDSDCLFPASEVRAWVNAYRAAGVNARYAEIASLHGHDAFLIEHAHVRRILAGEPS